MKSRRACVCEGKFKVERCRLMSRVKIDNIIHLAGVGNVIGSKPWVPSTELSHTVYDFISHELNMEVGSLFYRLAN